MFFLRTTVVTQPNSVEFNKLKSSFDQWHTQLRRPTRALGPGILAGKRDKSRSARAWVLAVEKPLLA